MQIPIKPKTIWNFINATCHSCKNKQNICTKSSDGFNKFFSNVAENIFTGLQQTDKNYLQYIQNFNLNISDSIFLSPVTEMKMASIINSLKNTDSTDIHIWSLNKYVQRQLKASSKTYSAHYKFNFETEIFPDKLKIAKIIPLFKSGDALNIENYRLIALFSILAKIIEIVIALNITKFFEKHNLFVDFQFHFRKNRSTC